MWLNEAQLDEPIISQLKSLNYKVEIYQDDFDCECYIRNAELHEKIVLIVSELLSKDIVNRLHDFSQLIKILILPDHSTDLEWNKQYTKVCNCVIDGQVPKPYYDREVENCYTQLIVQIINE